MHMDLYWCNFHMHVHDLPIGKMSRNMAEFIRNQVGIFREVDMESNGGVWDFSMRLMVSVNVTRPLLRVLKIRSV